MKNNFGLIISIFLITISFSQVPCILGDVYVSEAANQGVPADYIEVYNGGSVECTLAGFQLDDSEELEDFTFGYVILAPGDYWIGYENEEDSFSSGLDADGDIVVFSDAGGNMLTITLEESIEIVDGIELSQSYGSDGVGCYTLPTPGESNADCFESSCLSGDVNCDCIESTGLNVDGNSCWNVQDIVQLANCVLANDCASLENSDSADVNGDCIEDTGLNADGNSCWNVQDVVQLANCILSNNCGE